MKKKILIAVFVMLMAPAISFACNYTFDVSLVGSPLLDTSRSTPGLQNWYVWTYRVDVKSGGSSHNALSNWTLQLPSCYINSPLFNQIEASAGWGGGDQTRIYVADATSKGLKWEFDDDTNDNGIKDKWEGIFYDELDTLNEYDYFWFSAPTDESIDKDWAVKAGQNFIRGEVEVPGCPECGHQNPGVPEPASLSLLGLGLLGLLRKKNIDLNLKKKRG